MGGLPAALSVMPARSYLPTITVDASKLLSRIVAEQLLQLFSLSDADAADEYERYMPGALLVVPLEPAATSPFMDF
jgi:hypothetical protein